MRSCNLGRALATILVLSFFVAQHVSAEERETSSADPAEIDPAVPPPPAEAEPESAAPAPPLSKRIVRAIGNEAKRYATDGAALFTAPLSWDSKDWRKAAGLAVILGGLIAADESLDRQMQKNRSHFTDRVGAATTSLGGGYAVKLSGAILVGGLVFRDDNVRDMGREALEAGALSAILTNVILKPVFGRVRPDQSNGESEFHPFTHNTSFPSGHATEAFSVASVVAARSEGWVVPTLAYTVATVVALDRLNSHVHFTSDVVAGAAIGIATGKFLVHRHDRQKSGTKPVAELDIVPIAHGLSARVRF